MGAARRLPVAVDWQARMSAAGDTPSGHLRSIWRASEIAAAWDRAFLHIGLGPRQFRVPARPTDSLDMRFTKEIAFHAAPTHTIVADGALHRLWVNRHIIVTKLRENEGRAPVPTRPS